jgi:aryl-alcohol dehydrogenase-like predicted oxidoreductase
MSRDRRITRRTFVRSLLGGTALTALSHLAGNAVSRAALQGESAAMPQRPLGKTGEHVALFSLGGQATLEDVTAHERALGIINRAIDLGVNYIDTAPLYGSGASERYIGEVMKERRREVFLATKTDDRSYDGAMRSLEKSLRRLQTDRIDLWQIHNIQTDTDVDFIVSREGAVKALERAREESIVRFIGVTGHRDPLVLKRAIESHPFDAILMAINPADRHSASFIENLLPAAVARQMGIMAMKVPSRGKLFRSGGLRTMEQALRYALSHPVSTAVIGITDIKELEEDVQIAREFTPMTPEEMATLEALTKPYCADALWYRDHM